MFDKAKDMYQLQKKAKTIKKELKNTHIEAEEDGIIVTVNGEQEIISIVIPDQSLQNGKKLGDNLVKCFNKAIKKSQQVAAELMKDIMGNMNLPGL
ncbi:YbaB/EbfC family nucleoid-associated protein [Patescibacteria group bacterium]|nr:YbaB/EbfC family nucleoid-associated protein [Patescibacteria group bacterium]MBU1703015.1 YbaB/EbfC family nucleoid-associated protein [Patescibacteria group bacterium]MBU1954047.1 YbaB/EbfC family nucleoid-associated protein [Patescibacteria group bacterium]